MQDSLFSQGFTLLTYGMGTVFVFLIILIMVTYLVSGLITRYFPEPEPAPALKRTAPQQARSGVDAKTLKIIQAAVEQHRAQRG